MTGARPATICLERLGQSRHDVADTESGETQTLITSRFVTEDDASAYPILRRHSGRDVCEPLLNPPPWWDALAFWR